MKNIFSKLSLTFAAAALALIAVPSQAQTSAPATVDGKVLSPLGTPFAGGTVKLSRDHNSTDDKSRHYDFSFSIDKDGNYKGANVNPPGTDWIVFVFDTKNAMVDYLNNVEIKQGQENTINIDMSRKEYIDKMTPEERAELERVRKANSGLMETNKKIANLNASLTKARTEMKENPTDAVALMTDATTAKPDEPILWLTLAQAQQSAGEAAFAKSHKMSDEDVQKYYKGGIDSNKKALDLEMAKKSPDPKNVAAANNSLGQINGRLGNVTDAQANFDAAAKALPTGAYTYFNNEAATFYNAQKMDEAAAAADKAIAADATKPDPYYIKGQALINKATVDPATQKITAPPGCVEAYQKYLELAPTGPHAEEVKGVLAGIGETVNSKFGNKTAPAKKK